MGKKEKTTSLERFIREERTAGMEVLRILMQEFVKPIMPALVRKMDAETELIKAEARKLDKEEVD